MLTVLVLVSVIGVIFAPLLVRIIAPGFLRTPEKFETTVMLTRIVFPYILFLGMVAYSKGVLNSLNYFTTPAFSPVILNSTLILSLLFLCPFLGVKGVVYGVLIGGSMEVLLQLRPLRSRGFHIGKGFKIMHPIAKRVFTLLLPRAVGTAVYQMSVLVDTVLASLGWIVGAGGVAALYYSNRLVQLPLAVFGISLATAALPKMAREASLRDFDAFKRTISFSLRTVFMVMLPAAAGLMVLAKPIMQILFERGAFTSYSTDITVKALFFYSFGLFAYAGIKILVSAYYSMGDTRTPVKTASCALFVNIILNLALMWPLKIGGLALATSIAAVMNFVVLYVLLIRRIGDIGTREIISSFVRVIVSSVIMGVFTWYCSYRVFTFSRVSGISGILSLCCIIAASFIVYVAAAYILQVDELKKAFKFLKKRRNV
jgi:putative peptidoglycan lipid II flippase